MFQRRIQPVHKPKSNKEKCKIVVRKRGDRVEKSIEGNCSAQQLKALSEQSNIESEVE